MQHVTFDSSRPLDLVLLGRIAIDLILPTPMTSARSSSPSRMSNTSRSTWEGHPPTSLLA